jgi:ABC-2 type transport system ATP-binding protein
MEFFARSYLIPRAARQKAKRDALAYTGLTGTEQKLVGALTLDESQRVALARILMHEPCLLLLDEPTAGLAYEQAVVFLDLLKTLLERGKALVVASASLEDLGTLPTHLALLDQGKLLALGNREALMNHIYPSEEG